MWRWFFTTDPPSLNVIVVFQRLSIQFTIQWNLVFFFLFFFRLSNFHSLPICPVFLCFLSFHENRPKLFLHEKMYFSHIHSPWAFREQLLNETTIGSRLDSSTIYHFPSRIFPFSLRTPIIQSHIHCLVLSFPCCTLELRFLAAFVWDFNQTLSKIFFLFSKFQKRKKRNFNYSVTAIISGVVILNFFFLKVLQLKIRIGNSVQAAIESKHFSPETRLYSN